MPSAPVTPASPTPKKLVIVTGSGRSGTSTVAGTLKKLGLHVPQPEVRADASNPRGFFESRWALRFHKRVLAEAGVRTLDARPEAWDLVAAVVGRPDLQQELTDWLARKTKGSQILVKDPRAFWLRDLWVRAADDHRLHTEFLTMLRHPAEVVSSRDMHYLQSAQADVRTIRETANVAGWVNVALINERVSRDSARAFARYEDLITDWRSTMRSVGTRLDLTFNGDLGTDEHHPVDDFIDAKLRRANASWDGLHVHAQLRDIAETVWQALNVLVDRPCDPAAMATLDSMRAEYDTLHRYSAALVQDHTNSAIKAAREQTRIRVTREVERRFARAEEARKYQAGLSSLPRRVVRKARALRQT